MRARGWQGWPWWRLVHQRCQAHSHGNPRNAGKSVRRRALRSASVWRNASRNGAPTWPVRDSAGMETPYREQWQAEIAEMRRVLAGLELKEELKWASETYTAEGKNIVILQC